MAERRAQWDHHKLPPTTDARDVKKRRHTDCTVCSCSELPPISENAIYVHIKCKITPGFGKEKLSYSKEDVPIGKVTTVYREQMRPVIVFPARLLQAHKRPGACLNLDDPL